MTEYAALLRAQLELQGPNGWRLHISDNHHLIASRRGDIELSLSADDGDELLHRVVLIENRLKEGRP